MTSPTQEEIDIYFIKIALDCLINKRMDNNEEVFKYIADKLCEKWPELTAKIRMEFKSTLEDTALMKILNAIATGERG